MSPDGSPGPLAAAAVAADSALTARLLADLRVLVECESPTDDLAAVQACAALVGELGERLLGTPPERTVVDGRPHLRWRLPGSGAGRAEVPEVTGGVEASEISGDVRVLILCHYDTVWPLGTLARLPWRVDGDLLTGPGTFDMKAGLVMAMHALASMRGWSRRGAAAVTLLCTGDEETGSHTSRALIEAEARAADAALVLEASGPGGALKTARKGVALYRLGITGRAAHAGLEPERGVNAGIELALQVLAIRGFGDPMAGTSVVPTRSRAGTTTNTVPASADLDVDSRAWTAEEQARVDRDVRALRANLDRARVDVSGGVNRPPLPREFAAELFDRAVQVAGSLGLPAPVEVAVGGGSDGNFTAGVGTPTLDGLGAVGGAHADDEHVVVSELAPRTRLLAGLIASLGRDPVPRP